MYEAYKDSGHPFIKDEGDKVVAGPLWSPDDQESVTFYRTKEACQKAEQAANDAIAAAAADKAAAKAKENKMLEKYR